MYRQRLSETADIGERNKVLNRITRNQEMLK